MATEPNYPNLSENSLGNGILMNANTDITCQGSDIVTFPYSVNSRKIDKIFIQSLGENPETVVRVFWGENGNPVRHLISNVNIPAFNGSDSDELPGHVIDGEKLDINTMGDIEIYVTTTITLTTGIAVSILYRTY